MMTTEAGSARHRLGLAAACAAAVLVLVAVGASSSALAAGKKKIPLPLLRPAQTADVVPAPQPAPTASARTGDAIGTLIAQYPDESRLPEDSDVPQAGDVAVPRAAPAPMPQPSVPAALNSAGLKLALKLLSNGDVAAAWLTPSRLPPVHSGSIGGTASWPLAFTTVVPASFVGGLSRRRVPMRSKR